MFSSVSSETHSAFGLSEQKSGPNIEQRVQYPDRHDGRLPISYLLLADAVFIEPGTVAFGLSSPFVSGLSACETNSSI